MLADDVTPSFPIIGIVSSELDGVILNSSINSSVDIILDISLLTVLKIRVPNPLAGRGGRCLLVLRRGVVLSCRLIELLPCISLRWW